MTTTADRTSEARYRDMWKWDKVSWGCHAVDGYPGGCPWRVYSRDGRIVREEQASIFKTIQPGVPDMNPMGCQKGAAWSQQHYNEERVLYPMKRAGKRGEGKWERVSWDTAFTDVADAILDAVAEFGPMAKIYGTGIGEITVSKTTGYKPKTVPLDSEQMAYGVQEYDRISVKTYPCKPKKLPV